MNQLSKLKFLIIAKLKRKFSLKRLLSLLLSLFLIYIAKSIYFNFFTDITTLHLVVLSLISYILNSVFSSIFEVLYDEVVEFKYPKPSATNNLSSLKEINTLSKNGDNGEGSSKNPNVGKNSFRDNGEGSSRNPNVGRNSPIGYDDYQ